MSGIERVNAFSERIDAAEQRSRFEKEMSVRAASGKTVYPFPGKFIDCLENMPQSAGAALGLDRLVMLFADKAEIDDVVAFTSEEL
ncbi:MAG: amino acid--tRNA ligase-related protein [Syntrophaceae bacterium]